MTVPTQTYLLLLMDAPTLIDTHTYSYWHTLLTHVPVPTLIDACTQYYLPNHKHTDYSLCYQHTYVSEQYITHSVCCSFLYTNDPTKFCQYGTHLSLKLTEISVVLVQKFILVLVMISLAQLTYFQFWLSMEMFSFSYNQFTMNTDVLVIVQCFITIQSNACFFLALQFSSSAQLYFPLYTLPCYRKCTFYWRR